MVYLGRTKNGTAGVTRQDMEIRHFLKDRTQNPEALRENIFLYL